MQIIFSKIADDTFEENLEFLSKIWTEKETNVFLQDVEHIISELQNNRSKQFPKFSKNVRSVLIGKTHVRLFFKIDKNEITILLFFDMRQDFSKIKELLQQ